MYGVTAHQQPWPPKPLGGTDVNDPEWLRAHLLRLIEEHKGWLPLADLYSAWQHKYGFPLDLARYSVTDPFVKPSQLGALLRPDGLLTRHHVAHHLVLLPRAWLPTKQAPAAKGYVGNAVQPWLQERQADDTDEESEEDTEPPAPRAINTFPAGTPEAVLAAAVPDIVKGIRQLRQAFQRSTTTGWDLAHIKALSTAIDAHVESMTPAAHDIMTTMESLHELLGYVAAEPPSDSANAAAPNGMAVDAPESSKQRTALHISGECLRAAVLEIAEAQDCGCSLAAITGLETAVLAHFGAATWSELSDSSGSLLQLLLADAALMEALGGGPNGCARVPLEQVLHVTAQALLCSSSSTKGKEQAEEDVEGGKQAAVAACLCSTFHVRRVEQLGHGSVRRLLQLCCDQQIIAHRSPMNAHAMAAGVLPAAQQGSGVAGVVDRTAALECLRAAPDLADLLRWSQWDRVCAPTLGPLDLFLRTEGERAGLIALEVMGDAAACGSRLPGTRLLKLRSSASTQEFVECCTRGDARGVVCIALSLAVQSGGVDRAPLALLGAHMETCFKAMAAEGAARQGDALQASTTPTTPAVSAAGVGRAAAFAMRCLALLPQAVAASVAPKVLLQSLAQVIGGPAAAQAALLQAAKGAMDEEGSQCSVLHGLGWPLGITAWQEDWHQARMAPTHSHQQLQVAGSSALTAGPAASFQGAALGATSGDQGLLQEVLARLATGGSEPGAGDGMDLTTVSAASGAPAEDLAVATLPANMESCRAVIDKIRRDEFGVGVCQVNQEAAELYLRQNARMGRALARLSRELYSVDTHFVLELVQNADDNKYLHRLPPALEFVLQPGSITVLNNEGGFSASDVRALCDVGLSTKTKAGGGFIGQKGIGFKSVFKVTDAPQVHSNGFHVKFDLVADPALGYVLPTWVEEAERGTADAAAHASRIGLDSASTRITLPLKRTVMESDGGLSLRQRFGDVHPTLLLFLQKLKMLAITDTVDAARSTVMMKRELDCGQVELRHGPAAEHAARWLVVELTITKPTLPRLGETLAATKVALGFCLEGATPCQQQVFAFLPLRSYGLRFVVQGDFVVPTSREALDHDSAWNQMLRAEIPSLFANALEAFRRLPAPEGEAGQWAWVDRWLRCIPLDGEAQGFFSALPHSIAALLRAKPCIPTNDNELVLPGDALYCNTPSIRQLFVGHHLHALLGKRFLSPHVETLGTSPQLRALLGVHELSALETVELLKAMLESKEGQAELHKQGARHAQKLLLAMFEMLDSSTGSGSGASSRSQLSHQQRAQVKQLLQSMQVLPLLGAGWASVAAPRAADAMSEGDGSSGSSEDAPPIFFALPQTQEAAPSPLPRLVGYAETATPNTAAPAAADRNGSNLLASTSKTARTLNRAGFNPAWLKAGPHALRFIAPELLAGLDAHDTARLVHGLQSMGVKELSAVDVAQLHVLPAMAEPAAEEWPVKRLVSNLALFVVAGLLQPGCELEQETGEQRMLQQLKAAAVIALKDGSRCRPAAEGTQPVLLPKALGGAADWRTDWPSLSWCVPADAYALQPPAMLPAWKWLLGELGLQRLPAVVAAERTIVCGEQGLPEPWAPLAPRALAGGEWVVADCSCPLLEELANRLKADSSLAFAGVERLLGLLSDNWDVYSPAFSATCTPASAMDTSEDHATADQSTAAAGPSTPAAREAHTLPSSFAMCLRKLKLPTTKGGLRLPSSLFLLTEHTRALLGDDLDYLEPNLACQELAAALGVVCEVDAASVLSVLHEWSVALIPSKALTQRSPRRMAAVYRFLSEACAQDAAVLEQVRSAFTQHMLVWVPARPSREMQQRARLRSQEHQRRQQQQRQGQPQPLDESHEAPGIGRFMALNRLCLYDPSGVLEWLPEHVAPMRVVLCTYPSLSRFFAEQLGRSGPDAASDAGPSSAFAAGIRAWPDMGDCIEVVRAIAKQSQDARDHATWGGVLPVLLMWARQLASGQLMPDQVTAAAADLADVQVLLAKNGCRCVRLSQKPYLGDDVMLEELLGKQFGVHLLAVPDDATLQGMLNSSNLSLQGQQDLGGMEDGSAGADLAALLDLMGVRLLSAAVQREAVASGTIKLSDVYLAVSDVLPYIQRFLMEYWGAAAYMAREDGVNRALDAFKCQSAERLQVVYTLPVISGPHARSAPVQRSACLQGPLLLLQAHTSLTCIDVAQELSRVFNDGAEDRQIADIIFSLLMAYACEADLETVIQRAGVPPEHQASMLVNSWELARDAWETLLIGEEKKAQAAAEAAAAAAAVQAEAGGLDAEDGELLDGAQAGPSNMQARKRGREDGTGEQMDVAQHHMAEGETAEDDDAAGSPDQRPTKRQRGNPDAGMVGAAAAMQMEQGMWQPGAVLHHSGFVMGAISYLALPGSNYRLQAYHTNQPVTTWHNRARRQRRKDGVAGPTVNKLIRRLLGHVNPDRRTDIEQAVREGRITVTLVSTAVLQETYDTLVTVRQGVWTDDSNAKQQVGRWGEHVAFLHLQETSPPNTTVTWVNEDLETGGPFDIRLMSAAGHERFVEVKATMDSKRMDFFLSRREFEFAQNKNSDFSVLRVVGSIGAGDGDVFVMELKDPIKLWRDKILSFKGVL